MNHLCAMMRSRGEPGQGNALLDLSKSVQLACQPLRLGHKQPAQPTRLNDDQEILARSPALTVVPLLRGVISNLQPVSLMTEMIPSKHWPGVVSMRAPSLSFLITVVWPSPSSSPFGYCLQCCG